MKKNLVKIRKIQVDIKLYNMAGSENSQSCTNVFCGPELPTNPPPTNTSCPSNFICPTRP